MVRQYMRETRRFGYALVQLLVVDEVVYPCLREWHSSIMAPRLLSLWLSSRAH